MTRPDGGVDAVSTSYCYSASFVRLAQTTQESYLKDYRLFFDFLWQQLRSWLEATQTSRIG